MDAEKKRYLLKSCDGIFYQLKIDKGSGITLVELIKRAEEFTGHKIVILQCPRPMPANLFALSFLSEKSDFYVIFYDKKLTGDDQLLAVLHELGHILLGDLNKKKPFNELMVPEFFKNPQDPFYEEYLACRGLHNGTLETEQAPELVARNLIRILVTDGELSLSQAWSKMLG